MVTFIGYLIVGYVIPTIISLFVIRIGNGFQQNKYNRLESIYAFIPVFNILLSIAGLTWFPIVWICDHPTTQRFFETLNKFVNYK